MAKHTTAPVLAAPRRNGNSPRLVTERGGCVAFGSEDAAHKGYNVIRNDSTQKRAAPVQHAACRGQSSPTQRRPPPVRHEGRRTRRPQPTGALPPRETGSEGGTGEG